MSTTAFAQTKAPTATADPVHAPSVKPPVPTPTESEPAPDLATQLTRATRLGHNVGDIRPQIHTPIILQPKLRLGPVGDQHEQEADHVANQVVQRLALASQPSSDQAHTVQRQTTDGKKDEEPVQRQADDEKKDEAPVQAKSVVQRQETEEKKDEAPIQTQSLVQRQANDEKPKEEPVQAKLMVQRQATDEKQDEAPVQTKLIVQRQMADEKQDEQAVQPKLMVQRQATDEKKDEQPVQAKLMVQRQPTDEKKDEEPVQRQTTDEKKDEEPVQRQAADEKKDEKKNEEPVQAKLMVQRQAVDEKKDEQPVQAKALVQRQVTEEKKDEAPVQTQLVVQRQTTDEKKDDQPVQRQAADEKKDEQPVQAKLIVQRQPTDEKKEKDEQNKGVQANVSIQRQTPDESPKPEDAAQAAPDAGSAGAALPSGLVAPHVEATIHGARGGGQALAEHTQTQMGQAFGADFSRVRIHTDARSDALNQSLQARAFTTGQDIFFRQGEYNPESSPGQQLLAHELTHVLQQSGRDRTLQRMRHERLQPAPRNLIQAKLAPTPTAAPVAASEKAAEPTKQEETAASAAATPATGATATASKAGAEQPAAPAAEAAGAPAAEAATPEQKQAPAEANAPASAPGVVAGAAAGATPAAVAATVEGAAGATPAAGAESAAPVTKKAPASPATDPAFQAVVGKVKGVARQQRQHGPAKAKAKEAQAAAVSPPSEISGKAQGNQVGKMAKAEAPAFNAEAFKKQLMDRIKALAPKTAEQADEFKESNKLGGLKGEMQSKVAQERTASQAPLAKTTAAAPDTSSVEPKPVAPLTPATPGPAPADLGAGKAAPKAKGPDEVEAPFKADSVALDQQMAKGGVSEEQLASGNEPEFTSALGAKQAAQHDAQAAPKLYRQAEKSQLGQAAGEATQVTKQRTAAMHGDRAQLLKTVTGQQDTTKSEDEQARAKVGQDIAAIYEKAKGTVEGILSSLDDKVTKAFDAGAASAKQIFEDYVDGKMKAYKAKRYAGVIGKGRWLVDKAFDMPEEVNRFYEDGRALYLDKMDAVINTVVKLIGDELTRAKNEVAKGREEIQNYLATKVPERLKQVGEEAAKGIQGRFDELEQSVDAKQGALVDLLANKYNEHLKAIDSRIEQLKEANKGFVSKAADALGGVIKTILELKDMLLNVLARAAAAIGKIIKHPIDFLGHLINGVKLGLGNFMSNIGAHLQEGLISWLTGAIGGAGLTLPKNFDLPGIFQLVMQILGLSFDKIMAKVSQVLGFDIMSFFEPAKQLIAIYQEEGLVGLAKHGLSQLIGEEGVKALMNVVEIFQALVSGEWGKIWKIVSGYLESLKEMVFGKIQEFISERVIKAGITWVISLFNPAGAFIKACKAIYDIIMFFVERGKQILALVNAVIDSVAALADGNIGAAATAIENALARGIPVAIGFLSSLLGLGNVSEKVQEIIQSVRGMIDKALDAVFNSKPVQLVAGFIKKAIAKIKSMVKAGVNWVKGKVMGGKEKQEQDHELLAKAAAKELKQSSGEQGKDYEAVKKEKELKAKQIESTYTTKLQPGIKLNIKFENQKENKKGQELDFQVIIAPNTTTYDDKIEVELSDKLVTIWVVNDKRIRLSLDPEDPKSDVIVAREASPAKVLQDIMGLDQDIDEDAAQAFIIKLNERGILRTDVGRSLLISFAQAGPGDPLEYLRRNLKLSRASRGARQVPTGSDRHLLVDQGINSQGEQRETLSNYASVFWESHPGQFKARQIQKDPSQGGIKAVEFVFEGRGQPRVRNLGIVRVGDDGAIEEVVEITSEVSSKEEFIKIMRKARWTVRL